MQAIYTRYYGATNHRGARIQAKASGGSRIVVSYNYETNADMNHMMAAKKLAEKLLWIGEWVEGAGPDGRGNVYVFKDGDSFTVEQFASAPKGWDVAHTDHD